MELLLAQFADDTQFFLESRKSLENAIHILSQLETNIGLQVNYEKSSIICIGNAQKFECNQNFLWNPGEVNVLGIDIYEPPESCYNKILDKAKSVLHSWKNHMLTLIGKVLITNSLVGSLFVYQMQVQTNPPKNFYKQFNEIIHKFLWKNKRAKIPMGVLKKDINQGGVRLVDMELKNQSLKVAWIFRKSEYVQMQLMAIIPECLGIRFWDCHLHPNDVSQAINLNAHPIFWTQIIIHWFKLKKLTDKTDSYTYADISQTIIWYNSCIKINQKVVCYTNLANKGCTHIGDLYKNGVLLKLDDLNETYDVSLNWLQYHSLCLAIPNSWKNIMESAQISNVQNIIIPTLHEVIDTKEKPVKFVYNLLLEVNPTADKTQYKMFTRFTKANHVEYEQYQTAFNNLRKVTKIVKYRDFQYRLLNCAIHCNNKLIHWGIVSSSTCEICGSEKQTPEHLFYTCIQIRKLWKKLNNFMSELMMIPNHELDFTLENVLLNTVHPKPGHIANFIVLITKQRIYAKKCKSEKLSFKDIIDKIENIYQYEKFYNNTAKQQIRWAPYSGESIKDLQQQTNNYINEYVSNVNIQ